MGDKMNTEKTIKKVYKLLKKVTPLKDDCGKLCLGACCKGDNDTGMLLFPGEEKIFEKNSSFKIEKCDNGKNILICSGKCDRELRPISCRIFPLVPVLVDGSVYILDDPRAKGICPLLYDKIELDRKFEKAVTKSGKILAENEEICVILQDLTKEITEILSMQQQILG